MLGLDVSGSRTAVIPGLALGPLWVGWGLEDPEAGCGLLVGELSPDMSDCEATAILKLVPTPWLGW